MVTLSMRSLVCKKNRNLCRNPVCEIRLKNNQMKFCSYFCRNKVNSVGNHGGPKSKYKPEYASTLLDEYLRKCEEGSKPTIIKTKLSYIIRENVMFPSNKGFARYLRVDSRTFNNWKRKYEDFEIALQILSDMQLDYLVSNGLSGRYKSYMVQFLLCANHGFRKVR